MKRLLLQLLALVLSANVAMATTIYVDGTLADCAGSYDPSTRLCSGGSGTSYDTWAEGLGAFAVLSGSGHVLEVMGGTYTQSGTYGNSTNSWPNGTGWEDANSNIIRNRAGQTVQINATGTLNIEEANEGGGQIAYLRIEGDSRSNFIFNCNSCTGNVDGIRVANGTSHVRIKKLTIQNYDGHGVSGASCANKPTFVEVIDNLIQNNGDSSSGNGHEHGIYPNCADSWLIEHNTLLTNFGYGIHLYTSTAGGHTNHTVRYNYVEGRRSTATAGTTFGIIVTSGSGHKIHNNVVKLKTGTNRALTGCIQITGVQTGTVVYHNTCYGDSGSGTGVEVGSSSTQALIKNNIFDDVSTAINNLGGNPTVDYNLCPVATPDCNMTGSTNTVETATPGFVSAGTNFALAVGSAAINAGVAISGYAYNGAAPDLGAFETLTFTGGTAIDNIATVVAGAALNTPIACGAYAGFTVNVAGGNRTSTNIAANGTSSCDVTFDGAALSAGQAVTITYNESPGTATDGARIGGSSMQPIWDTGAITLTNLEAGASYTLTQTKGEKYAAIGPQSTNAVIQYASPGSYAAVRTKKKCTGAACPTLTFKLRTATDGESGTYADLPDTFGSANVKFVGLSTLSGMDEHTTSVTVERLTSEFSGMTTGAVVRCASGCSVPSVTLAQDSECEMVWIIQFDTDAADGTTYHFREYQEDGTALTYAANSTPSITIRRHTAGF